jgi:hypothetical protein
MGTTEVEVGTVESCEEGHVLIQPVDRWTSHKTRRLVRLDRTMLLDLIQHHEYSPNREREEWVSG